MNINRRKVTITKNNKN